MPKVKKPKTKIKQKQRQSQSVVVNIHNKRTVSRRKAPTRGGSGGSGVPYPIYLNSPSDNAPIIHNLPAQFQNTSAITLPVKALANIPTGSTADYPTATQLQTNTEDARPLVASSPIQSPIRNIKPPTPSRLTPFQVELQEAINARASRQPTPTSFSGEPPESSPFFISSVARRPTPIQSPLGIENIFPTSPSPFMETNPMVVPLNPRRPRTNLTGYSEEEKAEHRREVRRERQNQNKIQLR